MKMKNFFKLKFFISLLVLMIIFFSCGNSKKGKIFFAESDLTKLSDKEIDNKIKNEFSKDIKEIYFIIYPKDENSGILKVILNSPKGNMVFNTEMEVNPTWEVYGTTLNITPEIRENLGEYTLQIFNKPKEGEKPKLLGEGSFILKSSGNVSGEKTNSSTTSSDELKRKELELKEKELELKEQELNNQKKSNVSGISGKYPEGSTKILTSSDLQEMSKYELKIMRNEIFARYGYIFKTDDMRDYFMQQNWYQPKYNDVTDLLTSIEKANINLIKSFEK